MSKSLKLSSLCGAVAAALAMSGGVSTPAAAQVDPYIGQLMLVGYNFCPRGWINADGQLLAISQNSALFSLYGTTFGGDGRTTFALPDLRGRSVLHTGTGPGLSPVATGQKGGFETVTLTPLQMPAHSHTATLRATTAAGANSSPAGGILADDGNDNIYADAAPNTDMSPNAISVGTAGGSQSFDNRDPFLVMRWCVSLGGTFPSRN